MGVGKSLAACAAEIALGGPGGGLGLPAQRIRALFLGCATRNGPDASHVLPEARRIRALLLGCAAMLGGGCGGQPPFPGSATSLDDLGRGVMDAFDREDHEALERYRLTEAEHNEEIWPEFPAAQAEPPFPVDLAWRNIQLRNQRAVRRTTSTLAAARRTGPVEYRGAECQGDVDSYETFSVLTDCYVRFAVAGRIYAMQLFKHVLVRRGGYKIVRYYDDEPAAVTAES